MCVIRGVVLQPITHHPLCAVLGSRHHPGLRAREGIKITNLRELGRNVTGERYAPLEWAIIIKVNPNPHYYVTFAVKF